MKRRRPHYRQARQAAYPHRMKRKTSVRTRTSLDKKWLVLTVILIIASFIYAWFHFHKKQIQPIDDKALLQKKHEKSGPQFEFYNLLTKTTETAPAKVQISETINTVNRYMLQVASLQHAKDAEQLKAELTLLGFNVSIENLQRQGEHWYRIQVGPYSEKQLALKAQRSLRANHFNSLLKTVSYSPQ